LGGEVVIDVRRLSRAGQEDDGAATSAPVQHVEPNLGINGKELDAVFDRILPGALSGWQQ
jgi:hypothetical protein